MERRPGKVALGVAAAALAAALAVAANLAWRVRHAPPPAKVIPIVPARPPGQAQH